MPINGDPRIARIEDALGWAEVNLNALRQDNADIGPKQFATRFVEISHELATTRADFHGLIRGTFSNIPGRPSPVTPNFGEFELPDDLDPELREWILASFDRVEKTIKGAVALIGDRDDVAEIPGSRDGFIYDWTRIGQGSPSLDQSHGGTDTITR